MRRWIIGALAGVLVLAAAAAWAQGESDDADAKKEQGAPTDVSPVAHMWIPPGFTAQPPEEEGISRWRKDSAEIYLIVGELFPEWGEPLLKALSESAHKDAKVEAVNPLAVPGGKGLLIVEKAPEDPARLRSWRVVILADKKIMNVDFTAPGKDFDTFTSDFRKTLDSLTIDAPPSKG